MYSLQMAKKQSHEQQRQMQSLQKQKLWMKRYNSETKPRLLERYDYRINAFIRQIEEAPEDVSKIQKHKPVNRYPAFQFKLTENSKNKASSLNKIPYVQEIQSVSRSSVYMPISQYQFRQRQKQKQIVVKPKLKTLMYKKWQKERQMQIKSNIKMKELQLSNRNSFNETPPRVTEDNRSDNRSEIPSLAEDGTSLKLSVNNFDNLEKEAREYQKNRQYVEKKTHFKRLASLEQMIKDAKAKRSLHSLLVKGGITRPKLREEGEESEVDLLNAQIQHH